MLEGLGNKKIEKLERIPHITVICAGTLIGPLLEDDIHKGDQVR